MDFLSILMYICIYLISNVIAFRAYDCVHPRSNFTIIPLGYIQECPEIIDTTVHDDQVHLQVVQEKEWSELHVYQCSVKVTKTIYYCGMHSHISAVHGGLSNYIMDVDKTQCMTMMTDRVLHFESHKILGLVANSTRTFPLTIVGSLDTKGNCRGGKYIIPGYQYNDVVVQVSVTISLKDYNTVFQISSNNLLFNDGTTCSYSTRHCIHPVYGNTFWELGDKEQCSPVSRDVIYEGQATITYREEPFSMGSIVTVNQGTSLFSIKITRPSHVCHQQAFATDHPRIFILVKQNFGYYFSKSTINPRDVNLALYMNSKIAHSVHFLSKQIREIYIDLTHRDCLVERESMRNKLAIVKTSPMSFGNIVTGEPGFYNVIAGEVAYMIQCQPVDVSYRKSSICTAHLPISYNNQSMYLEPVARVITNTSSEVPCSPLTPPMYQMGEHWYAFNPQPHIVTSPEALKPGIATAILNFTEITGLMTSGIYDETVMDRFQDFLSFPLVKTETGSYMAAKLSNIGIYTETGFNMVNMMDESTIDSLAQSVKDKIFGFVTTFGSIFGTIWGLIVLYKIITKILSIVINTASLYNVFGCSSYLLASIMNSFTHYIITTKAQASREKDLKVESMPLEETPLQQDPRIPPDPAEEVAHQHHNQLPVLGEQQHRSPPIYPRNF